MNSYVLEVEYYPDATEVRALDDERGTFFEHTYDPMPDAEFESELEDLRLHLGYDECAEIIRRDFREAQPTQQRQRTPNLIGRLAAALGLR